MKKFLKIFLISLAVVVGLIIILLVAISIAVWDTTDNTPSDIREANVDLETFIDKEAVDTLDDAENKDDFAVLFDEHAMNELIFAIAAKVKVPFALVNGAYVAYAESNGALQVEIPVKFLGFVPTCLKARVKIAYENGTFSVVVEDAKVGNFTCTDGIVKLFVLNDINGRKWQKDLTDAGIYCSLDINSLSVTMTGEQITETVGKLTEKDPNNLLYTLICDLSLNDEQLLTFSFGEDGKYGVTLHAQRLAYDEETDGEIAYPLDFATAADQTAAKFAYGVNKTNVSVVFRYFVSGYDTLTDPEKKIADALGLKSNGSGVRSVNKLTMTQVLLNQSAGMEASLINHAATVTVTEKQINTILAGLDVIGVGTAFCYNDKLAYLALEDVVASISDRTLRLCVVFSLNGKRLCGYLDTTCPDADKLAVNAQINVLRLGKKQMTTKQVSTFLRYLDGVLENENWIYTDAEENVVVIDMEKALEGLTEYGGILRMYSSVSMQCRKVSGKGQLQLVFHVV